MSAGAPRDGARTGTDVPFLKGERVSLRSLREADVDGPYLAWLNDVDVCRGNSHHVFPYSREQALAYVRHAATTRDELILAVTLNEDGRHIGNVALTQINPLYRTAEFSILMGDSGEWGKGYALEAARLVFAHGFFSLNLTRIGCGTFHTNEGMIKLARALGMTQEGVRRRAVWKGGRHLDVVEFGILKEEFEGKP